MGQRCVAFVSIGLVRFFELISHVSFANQRSVTPTTDSIKTITFVQTLSNLPKNSCKPEINLYKLNYFLNIRSLFILSLVLRLFSSFTLIVAH